MELREEIIHAIRSITWPTNDDQVEGIEDAADAILSLPAIAEALRHCKPKTVIPRPSQLAKNGLC